MLEDPIHIKNLEAWYEADKKHNLRTTYPLNEKSIVFDVGAYTGDWALEIHKKYKCTVHCFEPVREFFYKLRQNVRIYPDVICHNFAISNIDNDQYIYKNQDGSGFYLENNSDEEIVEVRSIGSIFRTDFSDVEHVNLMKLNIEGEEYNVLEEMIEENLIGLVDNFQIQFHRDAPNYDERRKFIQSALAKTHKQTYNFDYIWENWEIKY